MLRDHTQPGDLPLRPLTTGELLDAAVVLLRTRGRWMITLGAVLAGAEQAVLFPLRRAADIDSSFLPGDTQLYQYGILVIVGLFTETFCIGWLGGAAASLAPRALLGSSAPGPARWRGGAVLVVVLLAGMLVAATGWSFLVLPVPLQVFGLLLAYLFTALAWPFGYGLVGLAAPAAVIDERGPARALLRSIRLASRNGMRASWIRVLGYTAWLFIRIGLGLGTIALVAIVFDSPSNLVDEVIVGVAWFFVNALAYPMLGCLDVALHLDTRMRTEGLDIALSRTVRRGVLADRALAVPR